MLLRYLLFFILLAVVWRLVRRVVTGFGARVEGPTISRGRSRTGRRRRDVDDAEFEILPGEESGPEGP